MRIVVPVKPMAQAKSRLGTVLSAAERAEVMRGLFGRVITAAREVAPVSVVTADRRSRRPVAGLRRGRGRRG